MGRFKPLKSDDPWTVQAFIRLALKPPPPPEDELLIIGDGAGLPDDLAAYGPHHRGDVMAVNMSGLLLPRPIDHWVTSHPELFFAGRHLRLGFYGDAEFLCHSAKWDVNADIYWRFTGGYEAQNSGSLAVAVALGLGYGRRESRIVIAGMPLDGSGHYFDPGPRRYHSHQRARPAFVRMHEEGRLSNVRAVSGWLAELLGKPHQLKERN